MKELSIQRYLDEGTRLEDVRINGKMYSVHNSMNGEEIIITDAVNYSIIYAVMSKDMYFEMVNEG